MTLKKTLLFSVISLFTFINYSCATSPDEFIELDAAVENENFKEAAEVIKRRQNGKRVLYSEKNAILLFLDKGLLEHYAGNYETSSVDLQNAERLIEEAYTKSISQGFLSYIINDNTKDYPGEDFEDIYINVFNALNYYNRGDIEGALVEIRKLSMTNGKLDLLARRHEYKDPDTGKSLDDMVQEETGVSKLPETTAVNFSNSALARFLGALFYQAIGDTDSARIEFEQIGRAFSANRDIYSFPVPDTVDKARNVPKGTARLNIISFTGLSPVKEEQMVSQFLPFQHPVLSFAVFRLPVLIGRHSRITRIEAVVGERRFDLELLEDISAVVEETYKARFSSIFLKTYIRTIVKYVVADIAAMETARNSNELAALFIAIGARAAMDASERADIRMSRYLPGKAHIGGINLDPGTYSVIINYYTGNVIIAREEKEVTVKTDGLNLIQSVNLK